MAFLIDEGSLLTLVSLTSYDPQYVLENVHLNQSEVQRKYVILQAESELKHQERSIRFLLLSDDMHLQVSTEVWTNVTQLLEKLGGEYEKQNMTTLSERSVIQVIDIEGLQYLSTAYMKLKAHHQRSIQYAMENSLKVITTNKSIVKKIQNEVKEVIYLEPRSLSGH